MRGRPTSSARMAGAFRPTRSIWFRRFQIRARRLYGAVSSSLELRSRKRIASAFFPWCTSAWASTSIAVPSAYCASELCSQLAGVPSLAMAIAREAFA